MAPGKPVPEWAIERTDESVPPHLSSARRTVSKRTPAELGVTARSLFSAVHGMVLLGLEQKLIAVPADAHAQGDRDHRARDDRGADGEVRLIARDDVTGVTSVTDLKFLLIGHREQLSGKRIDSDCENRTLSPRQSIAVGSEI